MMIEIAVADAFGRPYEFARPDFVEASLRENGLKYVLRPGEDARFAGTGFYTDDTQMSLGIAEHMLARAQVSQAEYAAYFLLAYKRDRRGGYSSRMRDILARSRSPKAMLDSIGKLDPRNSNGCVMRVVPLGLIANPKEVMRAAIVQATTTHSTVECVKAATAVALTAHYLYHKPLGDYGEFMTEHVGAEVLKSILTEGDGPIANDAMQTASFSIRSALTTRSMSEMLTSCIAVTGDVDSVAAISMGLASLSEDSVNDLPDGLVSGLENGAYGRGYLEAIDQRMFAAYPRAQHAETIEDVISK